MEETAATGAGIPGESAEGGGQLYVYVVGGRNRYAQTSSLLTSPRSSSRRKPVSPRDAGFGLLRQLRSTRTSHSMRAAVCSACRSLPALFLALPAEWAGSLWPPPS